MGGVMADDLFFQYLASSSGSINMNVSASSAAMVFSVAPDTSKGGVDIHRVNFEVIATGAITATGFGAGSSELAAGIKVQVLDAASSQVHDFLDGQTITSNMNWTVLAGTDMLSQSASSALAASVQPIRWTIAKSGAALHLPQGHRLAVTIQDDVSSSGAPALLTFRGMAQGVDH